MVYMVDHDVMTLQYVFFNFPPEFWFGITTLYVNEVM